MGYTRGIVVENQYQGAGIGIVLLVVKNVYTQYQTNTKIIHAQVQSGAWKRQKYVFPRPLVKQDIG